MWEIIQANKTKSVLLFMYLGICLILLGAVMGYFVFAEQGIFLGVLGAILIWIFLSLISYFSGDSILLSVSRAQEVTKNVHPQLFNIVEEMKIAANLPTMPKIYIINEPAPNAFATGRSPEKSSIAVTAGLLSRLNRDELQGVIAHEMSHIINRDVLFMTFAGVLMGTIVIISETFLRSLWYSSHSSRRYRSSSSRDGGGGQVQIALMLIAIFFAILSPILAQLFYFAISRKREYLADASAVRLTRYPEGLASALEKIANTNYDLPSANKITAPMYIVNPLKKRGMKITDLTSTHPPISERIKILRSISRSVDYSNYQKAYSLVKGGRSDSIIPKSALKDNQPIEIKQAAGIKQEVLKTDKSVFRNFGDIVRTVNNYSFVNCKCGLKFKIPPDFKKSEFYCTRCGNKVNLSSSKSV